MPTRPGRPEKPVLLRPRDMPKRKAGGSLENRLALLHALAHIELNAVDLAWDLLGRFSDASMPGDFFSDWVRIGKEEARHFQLLSNRLEALGSFYGAYPAHDGLWESAEKTSHDLLTRLAIVPLVLEARGLDVTPTMIENFHRAGDNESALLLQHILEEEIHHVRIGHRWYQHFARERGYEPVSRWQYLVKTYFRGNLKPPFNVAAREKAGFSEAFWNVPQAEWV